MNIVVLSGSPRKGANTDTMVEAFAETAREGGNTVEVVRVAGKKIAGCLGCQYCFTHEGTCVQKDDMADVIFELLGVTAADMSAFALSVSPMNIKAYGIAAIYPAAGKSDAVLEGLNAFIDRQKQSFEQYLADQYEIAGNARLETLEDGTILLVMCEDQDAVFDAIRDTTEGAA